MFSLRTLSYVLLRLSSNLDKTYTRRIAKWLLSSVALITGSTRIEIFPSRVAAPHCWGCSPLLLAPIAPGGAVRSFTDPPERCTGILWSKTALSRWQRYSGTGSVDSVWWKSPKLRYTRIVVVLYSAVERWLAILAPISFTCLRNYSREYIPCLDSGWPLYVL